MTSVETSAPAPLAELERIEALIAAGDVEAARSALTKWVAADLATLLRGLDDDAGLAAAFAIDALSERLALFAVQRDMREHVLAVRERLLPADHEDRLAAELDLAQTLKVLGDVRGALALEERVHATWTRLVASDHPRVLDVEQNLARTRFLLGDLAGAAALCEHVLEARRRALPADHFEVLSAMTNLAVTRRALGDLEGALALNEEVHAARERQLPADHPELLLAKQNLAVTRMQAGDPRGAGVLFEEVHAARERLLPADHPDLLGAKLNLAGTRAALGDLDGALALELHVHAAFERLLPADHPNVLSVKQNLANTLFALGDLEGARRLQEHVHAARQRLLPPDHPWLVDAQQNLASTLKSLRDFEGARVLDEAVLAVRERTLAPNHPDLLEAQANLAGTRRALGDFEGAHALFEHVHAELERLLPADHADLLAAKGNLAMSRRELGDFDGALALEEYVHATWEQLLPATHPHLLSAKLNLAAARTSIGDFDGARALEEHVHAAWERLLPADHPNLLTALHSLAATHRALGDFEGLRAVTRSLLAGQSALARSAALYASRQARSAAQHELERLSWCALWSSELGAAAGAALDAELMATLESLRLVSIASGEVARAAANVPGLAATLKEMARVRRVLADASLAAPNDASALEAWRTELFALAEQRDALERTVRVELEARGLDITPPSVVSIAAGLGEDAAFIGFWRHVRRTESAPGSRTYVATDALLAFVLTPDRAVVRVELGPIAVLEELATAWRAALGTPIERGIGTKAADGDAELAAGRALRAALIDPLVAALGNTPPRVLHIVPDDLVYLVPLDALPFDDGARVGERIAVRVDPSVARLVRVRREGASVGTLVAFGGVDYGAADTSPADHLVATATPPTERGGSGSTFEPLISSRFEAEYAAALFEEHTGGAAELRTRAQASEAELAALAPNACYLHVATHGWFAPESSAVSMLDALGASASDELRLSVDRAQDTIVGFLPETLCGLALAGANNGPEGILTAEELATLDLTNCELAVLSACETNVGIRRAGQGIQSLQTALHAAGARTAITSLWKVDDAATRRLFELFYTKLWSENLGPADALWQAKMALRSEGHPTRDWAGWVLTGDPD